jgi:DNA-binding XRE family transcriptional regulator
MPAADPGGLPRNRLRAVLLHIPWYAMDGPARLAADIGVSRSTIIRLLGGKNTPSPRLARAIGRALSRRLGKTIAVREIFRKEGRAYPTASVCELMETCAYCLPQEAYDERSDQLRPAWRHVRPGDWCRFPSLPNRPDHSDKPVYFFHGILH